MKEKCSRCGASGHTVIECTPAPCSDCGGVESHKSDACSVHRAMSRVPSSIPAGPRPLFPWERTP